MIAAFSYAVSYSVIVCRRAKRQRSTEKDL